MKKPKFNIGDKIIQIEDTPIYLMYNGKSYIAGTTVVTIEVINENKDENVYGFKECKCSSCVNKGIYAHWVNVEINFKLADIKPKPKILTRKMTQKDFASALKDIA